MDQAGSRVIPNLDEDWVFVKERGATARSGAVYRSVDGRLYLRTGRAAAIHAEAAFARKAWQDGFPVPEVTEIGTLPDGSGYFIETAAGDSDFGNRLRQEYVATRAISDELFDKYCQVVLLFLAAQLQPACRQPGPSQLRQGIQLANVQQQNPDIPHELFEGALAKAEARMQELPLVLTHGDLTPFNVLPFGIIDFEERFVAAAGFDTITSVTFQRFWDHPLPDGTGSMLAYDFSPRQIARFLSQADALFEKSGFPSLSAFFDDFLTLKAIWALCFERPADITSPQAQRWHWRRRVAIYCATCYLSDDPIASESFCAIGLDEA